MNQNYLAYFHEFSFLIYQVFIPEKQKQLLINSGMKISDCGVLYFDAFYQSYQKHPVYYCGESQMKKEFIKILQTFESTLLFEKKRKDYEKKLTKYTYLISLQTIQQILQGRTWQSVVYESKWMHECIDSAISNTPFLEQLEFSFQKTKKQ